MYIPMKIYFADVEESEWQIDHMSNNSNAYEYNYD